MLELQELTLENVPAIKEFGPSHFGSTTEKSFGKLKKLALLGLKQLEKWVLGGTCRSLHQLQELIIRDCPKFLGLPFDNVCHPAQSDLEGKIHWLPNLQVLEIENCPNVKSLPPIPWTQTLCSVKIKDVGSTLLGILQYSKSSSEVELIIYGKGDDLLIVDEKVLAFNNLTDLQKLEMTKCQPLELKHLQMLTSLKCFNVRYSSHVFLASRVREVTLKLPVEYPWVQNCSTNGMELTEVLSSHFPKLQDLTIRHCEKITQTTVVLQQQEVTTNGSPPSSPTLTMDDTQAKCHEQQIAVEVEEEKVDVGLFIFPANVYESLQKLWVEDCPELSLITSFHIDYKAGGVYILGDRGGKAGLQALHSLHCLCINDCPKFLSAYKASFSSSCCPFPSSLRTLELHGVEGMGTLEPLSNLTSLTRLSMGDCGEDLRSDGLWILVTQGQLIDLIISSSPKFFVGSDPIRELKDEYQEQLRRPSSKLRYLQTNDGGGALAAPICSLLSSSLVKLHFLPNKEVERFTKEQEEALQLLTSLEEIGFQDWNKLQCLPAGLHRLPNLKKLSISCSQAISSLPKDGLPSSLQELHVRFCKEELQRQCRNFVQTHPQVKLTSYAYSPDPGFCSIIVVNCAVLMEFCIHPQFAHQGACIVYLPMVYTDRAGSLSN